MQQHFGTGTLWGTATSDALGNTIANPTPIKFGVLQDTGFSFERDLKMLYGQQAFAVAVAGGKMKLSIKAKLAQISGRIYNDLFFGQALSTGTLTAVQEDLTGAAIPASPNTLTVTPPSSGTYARNLGVLDSNGLPMQVVASAPATGQYSVSAAGVYTFAAADAGKVVYISYTYTVAATNAKTISLTNPIMGTVPVFGVDFSARYMGKQATFRFPTCASKKLGFDPKQDDFAAGDFDIEAFADPVSGAVCTLSFSE
ncbi:hypothetical protein [Limnohabitans sp.]|uniref:hypothetical protein n=1 Tax=Limnohabitans sp. TaxID=1907725 RepID=UPI00286EC886|nr:hypothetical protein [Limnohabitans sp.]